MLKAVEIPALAAARRREDIGMGLMGKRNQMRLKEKEIVILRSSGSMIRELEGDGI